MLYKDKDTEEIKQQITALANAMKHDNADKIKSLACETIDELVECCDNYRALYESAEKKLARLRDVARLA